MRAEALPPPGCHTQTYWRRAPYPDAVPAANHVWTIERVIATATKDAPRPPGATPTAVPVSTLPPRRRHSCTDVRAAPPSLTASVLCARLAPPCEDTVLRLLIPLLKYLPE